MPSLLLIMLLYLSLAACFCEGRRLQTSLSHLEDVEKLNTSSPTNKEVTSENVYQATAMTGKSRSNKGNKMEDEIKKASRQNCFQKSKTVKGLQHIPPCRCRVSEENPGFHLDYEEPRTHTPAHN